VLMVSISYVHAGIATDIVILVFMPGARREAHGAAAVKNTRLVNQPWNAGDRDSTNYTSCMNMMKTVKNLSG
jgi:hypothetical protein